MSIKPTNIKVILTALVTPLHFRRKWGGAGGGAETQKTSPIQLFTQIEGLATSEALNGFRQSDPRHSEQPDLGFLFYFLK
jgi:hypothetical protein